MSSSGICPSGKPSQCQVKQIECEVVEAKVNNNVTMIVPTCGKSREMLTRKVCVLQEERHPLL